MADNPHKGHRERLKKRAAEQGFDSLAPHEQVELLLFYTIPQGNTNPTAHRLMERFGSLAGICAASEEELLATEGVGQHTVSFLRLIPAISRSFLESSAVPISHYDTVDKLESLLLCRYVGETEESVTLIMLGGKANLLGIETLSCGNVNAVSIVVREIIARAIRSEAVSVVLAHNHPGGLAIPSPDDLTATRQIAAALDLTGIPLLEHFIIADNRALPLMMGENLHGRTVSGFDARRFYASHMETTLYNLKNSTDKDDKFIFSFV